MGAGTERSGGPARRGPGRPSVAGERRARIVSAFLELVAEHGSDRVTIADVAERSGVARTAVRHFVGNRSELVAAALRSIADRYEASIRAAVGSEPTVVALVGYLFGHEWVHGDAEADRVFDLLRPTAGATPTGREVVREVFGRLHDELAAAMRRDLIGLDAGEADRRAYVVLCLAEQNVVLQGVGFDRELARGAEQVALELATRRPER